MSSAAPRRPSRQEQQLRQLLDTVPGNDRCADCEAPAPRWASHNLGIFLCTRCAGLHRKMGTHISQVKSISLDQWTQDQVDVMQVTGNTVSNYKYNPLRNWPMQDDDVTMERFIRDKYERKAFSSQRETANFTPIKSALKGGSKSSAPPPSPEDTKRYQQELQTLQEMGFGDRNRNVGVLKSVMGDIGSATDVLVAMESSDGKEPPQKPQRPRVRFTEDTIGGLDTPQLQKGNPFAAWTGSQAEMNPFSSIPPSLYKQQEPQMMAGSGEDNPFPPAAPLRQQLTGGQPLRPQGQDFGSSEQHQQPVMQPLRAQLTGLPTPQQLSDAQSQAYVYTGRDYYQPQPPQQQQHPVQGFANNFMPERPASAQPAFGVQQQHTGSANAFSQAQKGPPPPPPRHPFGVQDHQQQEQQTPGLNSMFAPLVPQRTAQMQPVQQQQHRPSQNQVFSNTGQSLFGQQTGQDFAASRTQVSPQATGPFGQSFTRPLQAQLTGIQNGLIQPQQQQQESNAFSKFGQSFQGQSMQSQGQAQNPAGYQISPQPSGFSGSAVQSHVQNSGYKISPQPSGLPGVAGHQQNNGYHISPQVSGLQRPQQHQQQQHGGFQISPQVSGLQQGQQASLGLFQTGVQQQHQQPQAMNGQGYGGMQQRPPFAVQNTHASSPFNPGQAPPQHASSPFGHQPQQQQQQSGFNPMQPFKTFDKASIMNLYNTGGATQQGQQQAIRPMMTGPGGSQQPQQQGLGMQGYAPPMQQQQPGQAFGYPQQSQQQQPPLQQYNNKHGGGDWYS